MARTARHISPSSIQLMLDYDGQDCDPFVSGFLVQFDREKVPERIVHARGMTAKGHFEVGILYFSTRTSDFPSGEFSVL